MNLLERVIALWTRQHPDEPLEDLTKTASRLSRRRFLQILGVTSAAVVAAPYVGSALGEAGALWTPTTMGVVPDMEMVGYFLTTDLITREALRILKQNLALVNFVNANYDQAFQQGGLKVGEHGMTSQFAVDCFLPEASRQVMPMKVLKQDFVKPMVDQMSNIIKAEGIRKFGPLELPIGVEEASRATDSQTGISVRAVKAGYLDYATGEYRNVLRLDVLGGPA